MGLEIETASVKSQVTGKPDINVENFIYQTFFSEIKSVLLIF